MLLIDELKNRLINNIDLSKDTSDEELNDIISELVMEEFRSKNVSLKYKMNVCRELFNAIRGLDILQEILEDNEVTEIMVNGRDNVFLEKGGRVFRYGGAFASNDKLKDVIQIIAARSNKRVNEASPILDTRLEDGSRVNIVLPPVSVTGPLITIRKFPSAALTMEKLIKNGTITEEAAAFLRGKVVDRKNIFISGGTGSGKTTFLNVLSNYIPKDERIITIEDSAELQIKEIENLVSLECRQANVEGENGITIRDLIRTSLRMRPDRIIVGEVRGEEALDMLQAMNTGHEGSLSTGHANSPEDMISRLETMVLMGTEMPLSAIRGQIASALDYMVHLERMRDGSRKVVEISEVINLSEGRMNIKPIFTFDREKGVLVNET
ncbi:MAG: CpaF family protein [Lachnospiraceae bacterium]|nr:CpaF family protein [Lachnospiraceae bacterium]